MNCCSRYLLFSNGNLTYLGKLRSDQPTAILSKNSLRVYLMKPQGNFIVDLFLMAFLERGLLISMKADDEVL